MLGHGVGLRESEEDGLRDAVFQRHPTSAKGFVQANHIRDDRGCALSQLILPGISTSTPWRSVQTCCWSFLRGVGRRLSVGKGAGGLGNRRLNRPRRRLTGSGVAGGVKCRVVLGTRRALPSLVTGLSGEGGV